MKPARALAAALLLAGCADLSTTAERSPARLELSTRLLHLVEGDTVQVVASVLDRNGVPFEPLPAWAGPVWASSDSSRLRVAAGVVQALAPGEAVARVSVAGLSDSLRARINPARLRLEIEQAYLVQSTQRWDGSVPLVQGRDALLRVFVRAAQPNWYTPALLVHLFHDGERFRTVRVPAASVSVPTTPDEAELTLSWNLPVPGAWIRPGTALLVEVDPADPVPLAPGSRIRFPASGEPRPLDVRRVPILNLRLVPIHQSEWQSTGRVDEENKAEFVHDLLHMFPVGESRVEVRTVYTTSSTASSENGWHSLLAELSALRRLDRRESYYYYGVLGRVERGYGMGYLAWPVAVGHGQLPAAAGTLAHELGHNFGMRHAPCGSPPGVDPHFPYASGGIGVFGFDRASGQVLPPGTPDVMSYCRPRWISDYTFESALDFRRRWDPSVHHSGGDPEPALLVWGRIGAEGPVLEPAFEVLAHPHLPTAPGPFRLEGLDAGGRRLFALSFAGEEVDHGRGERHFAFTLPAALARLDRLAELRLDAGGRESVRTSRDAALLLEPEESPAPTGLAMRVLRPGVVHLRWNATRFPMALVRDARTGEVLSLARRGDVVLRTSGSALDVVLSDGVRSTRRTPTPEF